MSVLTKQILDIHQMRPNTYNFVPTHRLSDFEGQAIATKDQLLSENDRPTKSGATSAEIVA